MKKLFNFKIIVLIVAVSTIQYTFGQDYKKNIKSDFIKFNDLINNRQFEKSTEYMLPEFFELVSKSQLISLMKQIFNNPDFEILVEKPNSITIDDSRKINNKFYSLISYSYDMKMKYKNKSDSDDKQMQELLLKSFEKTFGKENVNFNSVTNYYSIHQNKNAYAISNNGTDSWKFIEIDKQQKVLLEKLLPQEIIKDFFK